MADPILDKTLVASEELSSPVDADAPAWFSTAVNTPWTEKWVTVEDCRIRYQHWGAGEGKPGLVFVHGGSAHAHWWDFIAPSFIDKYQCVALDLSGMGDSDERAQYDFNYPIEIWSVAQDAGFPDGFVVVGHSFGGWCTMGLAHDPEIASRLGGIVVVDSPVKPPGEGPGGPPPRGQKRVYQDYAEIKQRFRLMPPQECHNRYIMNYIAHHSVKRVEKGFTWKFDDNRFGKSRGDRSTKFYNRMVQGTFLRDINCRMSFFYGENSFLCPEPVIYSMKAEAAKYRPGGYAHTPFICVPEAGHHLTLDQPAVFCVALRALLEEWDRQNAQVATSKPPEHVALATAACAPLHHSSL